MILTIKEAAALLNKLAKFTPDEKVEVKFLEGETVTTRPKDPLNILFAQLSCDDPKPGFQSKMRTPGTLAAVAPKDFFTDDRLPAPPPMLDEYFRRQNTTSPPEPWYYVH